MTDNRATPATRDAGITHARGADFLTHLQEVGAERAKRWHPTPEQEFTGLEWAGAMCGEAGEAANVAKKLRRAELSLVGNDKSERPALPPDLIAKLGRELADTLIYMVNVASHYGINLADATIEAFNNKSIECGFPERIARATPTLNGASCEWDGSDEQAWDIMEATAADSIEAPTGKGWPVGLCVWAAQLNVAVEGIGRMGDAMRARMFSELADVITGVWRGKSLGAPQRKALLAVAKRLDQIANETRKGSTTPKPTPTGRRDNSEDR